jgi:hypothetical protein
MNRGQLEDVVLKRQVQEDIGNGFGDKPDLNGQRKAQSTERLWQCWTA